MLNSDLEYNHDLTVINDDYFYDKIHIQSITLGVEVCELCHGTNEDCRFMLDL